MQKQAEESKEYSEYLKLQKDEGGRVEQKQQLKDNDWWPSKDNEGGQQ